MLLSEILEDVDLIVPNSLSNEKKIRWINLIARQTMNNFSVPLKRTEIAAQQGEHVYELPTDFDEQEIDEVKLDDERVDYDIIGGKIELHRKPTRHDSTLELVYRPQSVPLTEADMEKEPDFPADYHEILVLGCAHKVAMVQQQHDLGNTLQAEYILKKEEAKTHLNKKKRKSVLVTSSLY